MFTVGDSSCVYTAITQSTMLLGDSPVPPLREKVLMYTDKMSMQLYPVSANALPVYPFVQESKKLQRKKKKRASQFDQPVDDVNISGLPYLHAQS